MLERLLESRARKERSVGGTIASVTGHTAIVAAALYATAQTHIAPLKLGAVDRVHYVAPQTHAQISDAPHTTQAKPFRLNRPIFVDIKVVSVSPPAFDPNSIVGKPVDFGPGSVSLEVPGIDEAGGAKPTDGIYRSDQVETQAGLVSGETPPRYPESLRIAGVEGEVVAIFVVDEQGRAEQGSIHFLRSDNEMFGGAVRDALRRMRFVSAEAGGRKVRQLVQMPFVFKLSR